MADDKKMPEEHRRHDQRSPAGKFVDGVRGFFKEHVTDPIGEEIKREMTGKKKDKKEKQ